MISGSGSSATSMGVSPPVSAVPPLGLEPEIVIVVELAMGALVAVLPPPVVCSSLYNSRNVPAKSGCLPRYIILPNKVKGNGWAVVVSTKRLLYRWSILINAHHINELTLALYVQQSLIHTGGKLGLQCSVTHNRNHSHAKWLDHMHMYTHPLSHTSENVHACV